MLLSFASVAREEEKPWTRNELTSAGHARKVGRRALVVRPQDVVGDAVAGRVHDLQLLRWDCEEKVGNWEIKILIFCFC